MSPRSLVVAFFACVCCACARQELSLPPPNVPDLPVAPRSTTAIAPHDPPRRSFETKTIGQDQHPAHPTRTSPARATATAPARSDTWSPVPVYGDKNPSPPGGSTPVFGDLNPSPPGPGTPRYGDPNPSP